MGRAKPSSEQVVARPSHQEDQAKAKAAPTLVVRAQKLLIAAFPRRDGGFLFYRELENGNVDVYECSSATEAGQYLFACERGERFVKATPG
jgi:hypothetical protein